MDIKTLLKTSVAAGALLALAAPMASGSAEAGLKNQNSKVSLTVGGQIVRSLVYADDGEHSQLFHVDGRSTGTRLRYIVYGQLTESVKVGGLIEHDIRQSNDAFTLGRGADNPYEVRVSQETKGNVPEGTVSGARGKSSLDSTSDSTGFGIRHQFVSFAHKSLGKLSIGQTNSASNGSMELVYDAGASGGLEYTGKAMLSGIEFTIGEAGAFAGSAAGSHTDTFDGASRDDVIRYDTPSFSGLKLSTSMQDEGTFDVAVRYNAAIGGMSFKGAVHYVNFEAGKGGKQAGIVAAAKHTSGLSARIGYGGSSTSGSSRTPRALFGGVGYSAKISSLGATNFYFAYYGADDIAVAGNEMKTYYVGVVQKLDSIGSDVGFLYGKHTLEDAASTDYNDIDTVMFQTRLNF